MRHHCNVQILLGFLDAMLAYSCDENSDPLNKRYNIRSGLSSELRLEAVRICREFEELAQDLLDETNLHTVGQDIWLSRSPSCSGFPIEEYPQHSHTLCALARSVNGFCEVIERNNMLFPKRNELDGQNQSC